MYIDSVFLRNSLRCVDQLHTYMCTYFIQYIHTLHTYIHTIHHNLLAASVLGNNIICNIDSCIICEYIFFYKESFWKRKHVGSTYLKLHGESTVVCAGDILCSGHFGN